MDTYKFKFLFIALFVIFGTTVAAQTKDNNPESINTKDSYFSMDINYISDAIFMGRKDSIESPYLYPSLMYHHKSGFYTKASFSYLTKKNESRIDVFLISAGYDFNIGNFYGDISATKYFFNEDSYNVISEVIADFTTNFLYDFTIVDLSLSASAYFNTSDNSDLFLSSEISHDFITNNYKFQISPTIGVYFGSQNFYQEYFVNNRFTRGSGSGGSGHGNGSGMNNISETIITTVEVQESEQFSFMALEFGVPMWYRQNSFTFSFLPTLVLPQNESNLLVDSTLVKENLETSFYWVLGIAYNF